MATPFSLGYRMPAEWEKHEATWLAWPKNPDTFPKGVIEPVETAYVQMIEALAKGEKVNVLMDDGETEDYVNSKLGSRKNVIFHHAKTADVWIRDYGPIFVKNGAIAATKWIFNAWGEKWLDLKPDNESGMDVAKLSGCKIFESGIVLEGGSIDNNGLGTCLTTEQCLLNKNRNPHLNKRKIEDYLKDFLGFTNILWLKEGIVGDDTDGHVDDVARFVTKDTVVCAVEEDANDENYKILKTNLEILRSMKDQDGNGLNVVELPMPKKMEIPERRLPASYANFYIGNAVVLVPVFNDESDEKALDILKEFFDGREVVGIPSKELVYGYGGIHCATQQQPF